MGGSHWNRHGRKSGGNRPVKIVVDSRHADAPALSIQCSERRHSECAGNCEPFFPGKCECPCHKEPRRCDA